MTSAICGHYTEEALAQHSGLPGRRTRKAKYEWRPEYDAYLKDHYFGGLNRRFQVWTVYGEALVGTARVTGPIPSPSGFLGAGAYVNKLAWVLGGGLEYDVSSSWALRAGPEYLHTAYFVTASRVGGQNNIRVVAEIVHRFGGRRR